MQDTQIQNTAPQNDGKTKMLLSLIFGIVGIVVGSFAPSIAAKTGLVVGIIINVLAIILSIAGICLAAGGRKAAAACGQSSGLGTAGLVVSIIAVVVAVTSIGCTACTGAVKDVVDDPDVQSSIESALNDLETVDWESAFEDALEDTTAQ